MKIALVHDYLVQFGGAERVLLEFHRIWPNAPIFTLIHDPRGCTGAFDSCNIRTSFLQKFPFATTKHRLYPVFMPMAMEQFDFSEYDVVLSSSTSFAKGVITGPDTIHICYCHTPMRYVWDDSHHVVAKFRSFRPVRKLLPFALNYLRFWDSVSSSRVDHYIANSENVQRRIQKYYRRNSDIIYPPVDVHRFSQYKRAQQRKNYLLMVGRLLPYKGFDIGIQVANILNMPIQIIGDGPELRRLQYLASRNHVDASFHVGLSDQGVVKAMCEARVLLFCGEEDFGIVPLEAALAGCPVVAYGAGGALETVVHQQTGILVQSQDPQDFSNAVRHCFSMSFNETVMRTWATTFSISRFRRDIQANVETRYDQIHNEACG